MLARSNKQAPISFADAKPFLTLAGLPQARWARASASAPPAPSRRHASSAPRSPGPLLVNNRLTRTTSPRAAAGPHW